MWLGRWGSLKKTMDEILHQIGAWFRILSAATRKMHLWMTGVVVLGSPLILSCSVQTFALTNKVNLIFLVFSVCSPPCLDTAAAYPWSCPRGIVSKQYQCDERIRRNSCRGYIQNCRYRIWHLCVLGGDQILIRLCCFIVQLYSISHFHEHLIFSVFRLYEFGFFFLIA